MKKLIEYISDKIHRLRGSFFRKRKITLPHPEYGESLELIGFVQNDGYSCGAIAGYIVTKSIYKETDFESFYTSCNPCPKNGTSDTRLVTALNRFGIAVKKKTSKLTFKQIKKAISDGYPLITTINYWKSADTHWVVIYGYENKSQKIYIANPERGAPHIITYNEYEKLYEGDTSYTCWGKK